MTAGNFFLKTKQRLRPYVPASVLKVKDAVLRAYRRRRFLRHFSDYPVIHNARRAGEYYEALLRRRPCAAREAPEDLELISWSNSPQESFFEKSLKVHGIGRYVILGREVRDWNNTLKITLTLDHLKRTPPGREYVLWADARDVVFLDGPGRILDVFLQQDCDLFFSSTSWFFPDCPELKAFAESVPEARGVQTKYLNAGFMVARRNFLVRVLEEAVPYIGRALSGFMPHSDQVIFTELHRKHYPRIRVDYRERMAARRPKY